MNGEKGPFVCSRFGRVQRCWQAPYGGFLPGAKQGLYHACQLPNIFFLYLACVMKWELAVSRELFSLNPLNFFFNIETKI
jgi:hypothetical protein